MTPKDLVTLAVSARILANVEALNMAESVGNVSRHRRAPAVVGDGGKYWVVYVPAVSGESLAHHFQRILANIAKSMSLPVTKMDEAGYFLKYASNDVIKSYYFEEVGKVIELNDRCKIETELVRASVVADVGGFLYTDKLVKRTSRVRFGYMIPALDAIKQGAAASYPQLHTRYSPEVREKEQALYYVESGSSLYTFTTVVEVSDIAELEYCKEQDFELVKQKSSRIEASLKALIAFLDSMEFGAKRSRYMPQWDVKSLLIAVSKGPVEFVTSPPVHIGYVERTVRRSEVVSKALGVKVSLFMYDSEGITIPEDLKKKVAVYDSHTEALSAAVEEVLRQFTPKT